MHWVTANRQRNTKTGCFCDALQVIEAFRDVFWTGTTVKIEVGEGLNGDQFLDRYPAIHRFHKHLK